MHEGPVIAILFVSGLVITLAALYLRHRNLQMLHQERMAALEKGAAIPIGSPLAPWSSRNYLLRGLIWTFGGAALTICLLGIALSSHRAQSAETLAYRARSVSQNLEIPIEQARQLVEKDPNKHDGPPASIALFGLIPLGVGLAYLVYYRSGDARKESPIN